MKISKFMLPSFFRVMATSMAFFFVFSGFCIGTNEHRYMLTLYVNEASLNENNKKKQTEIILNITVHTFRKMLHGIFCNLTSLPQKIDDWTFCITSRCMKTSNH